ncbi:MAG: ISL3 family transposase [Lentisphaerae bacterium]|nr:ISL3 family transposase [Lentisphaerota bacterium]MCP4672267.1 ISL3 family transposase [Desulfobacula sp.]
MYNNEAITKLLGIQGWNIKSIEVNDLNGSLKLQIERENGFPYECAVCGQLFFLVYDHYPRRIIEDLSAWGRRTFIEFSQARVFCNQCGGVQAEKLEFVERYQHQTVRFQRYLASLCDFMPVADVAELTGISKDTIYRIDKFYLKERHELCKEENDVNFLGIDEIAIKKGHKYAVVFYDLERGQVIGLQKGRRRIDTSRFFRRWGRQKCLAVKGVCTDLWAPYHKSIRIHLKNAMLVFDKFHIFKYLSDAIDQVRRHEQHKAEDEGKTILKGCRWIMLKKDLSCKQKRKLKEVMAANNNIAKAMLLKDSFSAFYEAETEEEAAVVLDEWTEQCKESELKPFKKLAKRLMRWENGILSYFSCRITNGMSEGINNKIKVIKRRSYGFRDMNYFFLKILQATGFIPGMREVYP